MTTTKPCEACPFAGCARQWQNPEVLAVGDPAAVRHWQANATEDERRWAASSLNLQGAIA